MNVATAVMMLAVLIPSKTWFAPNQPLNVMVKAQGPVTLVATDFSGKPIAAQGSADITGEKTVDVRAMFPSLANPGTYVVFAVPKGGELNKFLGTPLVVSVRADKRRAAPPGPMVIKIEPLRYAVMETEHGPVTMAFYYDVAPNTTASFQSLAEGGYFDGLTFHRIVPGFVIQGGDPRGDGTGGPGYQIEAEFNDKPHLEGVLSMARNGDPNEAEGGIPRSQYANSAGSQFFVCLNYENTKSLDRKYTAFGKVTDGMAAVKQVAATPLADERNGRPATPQVIKKVSILPVTADKNPYKDLIKLEAPATPVTGEVPTIPPTPPK
jgi:peptidyl-prolyl cis-trans isomerase B (cyclophilin B)